MFYHLSCQSTSVSSSKNYNEQQRIHTKKKEEQAIVEGKQSHTFCTKNSYPIHITFLALFTWQ